MVGVLHEWLLDIEETDLSILEYLWMTWTMWHIVFNAHMRIQFIWSVFTTKVLPLLTIGKHFRSLFSLFQRFNYRLQHVQHIKFIILFVYLLFRFNNKKREVKKVSTSICINLECLIVLELENWHVFMDQER